MQTESVFSLAKQIDLVQFIEWAGNCQLKKASRGLRGDWCPACGRSRKTGDARLWINNGWSCHSCGEKGDVIDAARFYFSLGSNKLGAARKLVEEFGSGQLVSTTPVYRPSEPSAEEDQVARQMLAEVIHVMVEDLGSIELDPVVVNYLHETRKISLATIYEAQRRGLMVSLPSNPVEATKYLKRRFAMDTLIGSGLWSTYDDGSPKKMPAIAFRPIVFISEEKKSAEFRLAAPPKGEEPKSIRYGRGDWWKWQGSFEKSLIVEGCIDLLSAVDLGAKSTIYGIPGCNSWKSWSDDKFASLSCDVQIILDNDASAKNPGQKWAQLLLERLSSTGRSVANWVPPVGCDLNDVLRRKVLSAAA